MHEPSHPHEPTSTIPSLQRTTWGERIGAVVKLLLLLLFVLGGLAVSGVIPMGWFFGDTTPGTITLPERIQVTLVPDKPRTLRVPRPVREALGMRKGKTERVAIAEPPKTGSPLVLPGSTALDPARLLRIRARFSAEVVDVGTIRKTAEESKSGESQYRELRTGDRVRKGTVLGVFYSVDVGSRKNDLYDAMVQFKLDKDILERAESARGSVPEIFILNARRNVLADRNAISRAENFLRTWNIPQDDIDAVRQEAEKADLDLLKSPTDKDKLDAKALQKAKHAQVDRWARVELKAPYDAEVIERNIAKHEIVVDNTVNLFVLARVDQILVVANAPEDDLPALQALTYPQRRWIVRTVGTPVEKGLEGPINEIGYLIDPNQHTAVVKGYIDNPGRRLRGGQFVTVTIHFPPPLNVVEIPMSAIVDDGNQGIVFVQPDPTDNLYTMRRVLITHRFEKTAFVCSKLTPAQKLVKPEEKAQGVLPPEPLRPGERVILSGALELKRELEDQEAKKAESGKQ